MITINLLPIGAFKEKFKGRVFLAAYGIAMLIAVVALFTIKTNIMDGTLEALNTDKANQENTLATVKKQVTDASLITTKTFQQWQQLAAIVELEERRRDQTRLLVELEELVPKSDAWLLSLSHNQGLMTLEALSRDKEIVSQFLNKLENATYIDRSSVNLLEITQDLVINGIKLTKFKVTAMTTFPSPKVIDEGMPDFGLPSREEFLKTVEAVAPNLVSDIKTNATKSGQAL